jgi:hypothetical protein
VRRPGEPEAAARPAWRRLRPLLVAGYLGFVVAGFLTPHQPRVFWTMLLPLLVLFVVLVGFHPWRALCPLAAFGEIGHRLGGSQRRVPGWLERGHFVVPLALLATMLLVRLVATNGDGRWLATLLVVLALSAVGINWMFTGKTWCNFFCPVGVVERIYTDPSSLAPAESSQCARCTACKKSCPDIDQENNYWRELGATGRRLATYAFPGVVLAFYTYFWLRAGDWEAYFDGRWTRQPVTRELVLGAGFFFAPGIPAVAAAALTLAAFALASWALFRALDTATRRRFADADRHRHVMLSLAAFAAFSLFYLFAGAPTLRKIPYGARALAFVAPAVAVLVLARRWGRSREAYIRDKGAAKLLRNWPFAGEPPRDPLEAYAQAQASEQAREQLLAGYAQTLADVVADGLVDESEMRLLEEIRRQFGITPREHERIVAKLAEEERELFASGRVATVEERLQLETYRAALTEALLRAAGEGEIESLRRSFGVGVEDHRALVARLRSGAGPLLERARRELAEARRRREDRAAIAARAGAGRERGAARLPARARRGGGGGTRPRSARRARRRREGRGLATGARRPGRGGARRRLGSPARGLPRGDRARRRARGAARRRFRRRRRGARRHRRAARAPGGRRRSVRARRGGVEPGRRGRRGGRSGARRGAGRRRFAGARSGGGRRARGGALRRAASASRRCRASPACRRCAAFRSSPSSTPTICSTSPSSRAKRRSPRASPSASRTARTRAISSPCSPAARG